MKISNIESSLSILEKLNYQCYRKDFLLTTDKTNDELLAVMHVSEILRTFFRNNISTRLFQTGLAVAQFRDKSTRTRFSFSSAANLLGLSLQELDETKSQISHGETVRETSNMISFLSEAIGIRDDMYIGLGHSYMLEVAEALDEGFDRGVLSHRPAIVNLQCDIDHPTQSMSDLQHLINHFGGVENLKGKKLAMTWAYSPSYGKPLSVPQGLISLLPRFGMDVTLAHPEGYDLLPDTVEKAKQYGKDCGGGFKIVHSMDEAFTNANVVYPKSWAPFSVMEERTQLVRENRKDELDALEDRCLERNAKFIDWECNAERMKKTRNGNALYMHCLPADISGVSCERGEVSAEVFEKYRIDTYYEARYKPYVIAAMIFLSRFRDPVGLLDALFRQRQRRAGFFNAST